MDRLRPVLQPQVPHIPILRLLEPTCIRPDQQPVIIRVVQCFPVKLCSPHDLEPNLELMLVRDLGVLESMEAFCQNELGNLDVLQKCVLLLLIGNCLYTKCTNWWRVLFHLLVKKSI